MNIKINEQEFLLLENIIQCFSVLFYAGCFCYFHGSFLAAEKGQRYTAYLRAGFLFMLYSGIFFMDILGFFSVNGVIRRLLILFLVTVFSGFFGTGYRLEVFLCIIFFSCQNLSFLMLESMQYVLNAYFVSQETRVESMLFRVAVIYSIVTVCQLVLCFVMLWQVKRCLYGQRSLVADSVILDLSTGELCYLLFIPVAGILFVTVIIKLSFMVQEKQVFLIYEEYPVFRWLIPLISLFIYIGMLVSIKLYEKMHWLQEERSRHFAEQIEVHAIKERMEEAGQFYSGFRQMKHEMRNHLSNIQGLAQSGHYNEIETYVEKIDADMGQFSFSEKTGNPVTDVIIGDKKRMAERQEISFHADFIYPCPAGYDAYDIGIILNNLLVNAIEACGQMEAGEKYIFLSGRQKGKFYFIECRNPFDGEIIFDKKTELPVTTKKGEDGFHGIGLANVRREAEKYLGDVSIHIREKEFHIKVMLQEKRGKGE